MNRLAMGLILVLGLGPCVATAGTLCVQNDANGDAFVIKGAGKGAKAVTAYLAHFQGGSSYVFVPLSGSAIVNAGGDLAGGFTEYGVDSNLGFNEVTRFHRLRCSAGSDGKLGELDNCQDIAWTLPGNFQSSYPAHVVPCLPQLKVQ